MNFQFFNSQELLIIQPAFLKDLGKVIFPFFLSSHGYGHGSYEEISKKTTLLYSTTITSCNSQRINSILHTPEISSLLILS